MEELKKIQELGIEDDFSRSLKEQFEKYGKLSDKQITCLQNKIKKFFETKKLLEDNKHLEDKTIYQSLRDQFYKKKYLSPNQTRLLNSLADANLPPTP